MNPLVLIHIAGGSAALLAGAAALLLRKGGRLHARAGTVFFVSMLVLAGTGTWIAALAPERGTARRAASSVSRCCSRRAALPRSSRSG